MRDGGISIGEKRKPFPVILSRCEVEERGDSISSRPFSSREPDYLWR